MKKLSYLPFLLLFSVSVFATSSPKKGIKPPEGFVQFQQIVSKSYSEGYYAQKFKEKKLLREQAANGVKSELLLTQDTVFALTLLGQYSDLSAHYSASEFQAQLFDGPNPTGTVKNYYDEISYHQLYFDGHCDGWYDMPGTLNYYLGLNYGGPQFALDLVNAADPTLNFADYVQYYDSQNNPRIGFIEVIHVGAGAEAGANNIWSHRWNFRVITGGQPFITNDIDPVSGKHVLIDGDYAIEPELSGSSNYTGNIIEIGVFAHEFGHILGLPDLYDTDNSSEGLGNWCLMSTGNWGGDSNSPQTPTHMSAWCKKELGWIIPENLEAYMGNLSVPEVEANPVTYKLWTYGSGTSEYFLVENRQKIGFDVNLPNSGLLIFHIDETQSGNTNEDHYLVDLEQADGLRNLNLGQGRGDAGDPFPGSYNNIRFDLNTNPNSKDYNLQDSYVSVRSIHTDGMNIIGDFDIGSSPYLEIDSVLLIESVYQNGRVDPGENGAISFTIHNTMPVNSDATIAIGIDEPGIVINHSSASETISGNSISTITIPEAISVEPGFIPRTVKLNYNISYENDHTITDSLYLPVGIPEILLVSRTIKTELGNYYMASLDELGRHYEESRFADPVFYYSRKAIIIYTGKTRNDIFTQTEIDSLTEYLNLGGKIFFSGQNIAEYLQVEFPDFLHEVIGINWEKNELISIRNAYGVESDFLGHQFEHINFSGNNGANNDISADAISSLNDFQISLTYKDDGTDPAGGWIDKFPGGKVFFLGFGLESINDETSSLTRTEVLDNILQWFDGLVFLTPGQEKKIVDYNLAQNYPNPFNPTTIISWQSPEDGLQTLKIYDILGKEVKTLVNEYRMAGKYEIKFDGSNLASGIYYYKITMGKHTRVRKMILIK